MRPKISFNNIVNELYYLLQESPECVFPLINVWLFTTVVIYMYVETSQHRE
jgi:hypothetical protein